MLTVDGSQDIQGCYHLLHGGRLVVRKYTLWPLGYQGGDLYHSVSQGNVM